MCDMLTPEVHPKCLQLSNAANTIRWICATC